MAETWELAERVRTHVAGCNFVAGGAKVQVTMSLGIAIGGSAADAENLLCTADTALYIAKNAGRNRVEPRMQRAATASSHLPSVPNSDFWL
jgi:diguanylate cyclase (GGDEF)-like protein